jgi:hypothetical protein
MAHGRSLFYRLSTSGLSLRPFNLRLQADRAAFQHYNRQSAREGLVGRKNNCDRKARTNKYLGLSSERQYSFRKAEIRGLWGGQFAWFAGALERAKEASKSRIEKGIWEYSRDVMIV